MVRKTTGSGFLYVMRIPGDETVSREYRTADQAPDNRNTEALGDVNNGVAFD